MIFKKALEDKYQHCVFICWVNINGCYVDLQPRQVIDKERSCTYTNNGGYFVCYCFWAGALGPITDGHVLGGLLTHAPKFWWLHGPIWSYKWTLWIAPMHWFVNCEMENSHDWDMTSYSGRLITTTMDQVHKDASWPATYIPE